MEQTPGNKTLITEDELTADNPYHLLYCLGAIFAAVSAALYFTVYHFCLKKRCLAPNYRKSTPNQTPPVQGTQ